jgi:hypothetical protein
MCEVALSPPVSIWLLQIPYEIRSLCCKEKKSTQRPDCILYILTTSIYTTKRSNYTQKTFTSLARNQHLPPTTLYSSSARPLWHSYSDEDHPSQELRSYTWDTYTRVAYGCMACNGHQVLNYYNEIRLCANNRHHFSINWKWMQYKERESLFWPRPINFCISILILKLEMTICVTCNC